MFSTIGGGGSDNASSAIAGGGSGSGGIWSLIEENRGGGSCSGRSVKGMILLDRDEASDYVFSILNDNFFIRRPGRISDLRFFGLAEKRKLKTKSYWYTL